MYFFLQSLPDKDGKKCLFIIKCLDKSFECSASDKKKKQEWIQGTDETFPATLWHQCLWFLSHLLTQQCLCSCCCCCGAESVISVFLCPPNSHPNLHPAAEVGSVFSSPWGPAEAQGAAAEAERGRGQPGGEDEAAAGGQWEQTEAAGGHEGGAVSQSTLTTSKLTTLYTFKCYTQESWPSYIIFSYFKRRTEIIYLF